jgi:3-oxoacyl-[acyl-carrier protein] reductase
MTADLSEQDQIQRLVEKINKAVGRVDILYNVAGVWHNDTKVFYGQRLDEISLQQINEVMNVNLIAPMLMARALVKLMASHKSGKIINISGTFSNGGAKWLHYYVSKRAVEDFTIGLADELREFEIQVNCISPSDVASQAYVRFFPDDAQNALDPNEIAKVAIWLAKEESDNISGQVIVIKSKLDYSPIL